jgi:hypothetical protein
MKIFKAEITETLTKTIDIKANSKEDALKEIQKMYNNEEIILDSSDYINTEIQLIEE